jgi:hypothetical protein
MFFRISITECMGTPHVERLADGQGSVVNVIALFIFLR